MFADLAGGHAPAGGVIASHAPVSMRNDGDPEPLELRHGPFISGSTHTVLFLGQRPLSGAATHTHHPTPPRVLPRASSSTWMQCVTAACCVRSSAASRSCREPRRQEEGDSAGALDRTASS